MRKSSVLATRKTFTFDENPVTIDENCERLERTATAFILLTGLQLFVGVKTFSVGDKVFGSCLFTVRPKVVTAWTGVVDNTCNFEYMCSLQTEIMNCHNLNVSIFVWRLLYEHGQTSATLRCEG